MKLALFSTFVVVVFFLGCAPAAGLPEALPSVVPVVTRAAATSTPCPSRTAAGSLPTMPSGVSGSAVSNTAQGGSGQTGESTPGAGSLTVSPEQLATTQALFGRANKTGPTPVTPAAANPASGQPGAPAQPPTVSARGTETPRRSPNRAPSITPHLSPDPAPSSTATPFLPPNPGARLTVMATECP